MHSSAHIKSQTIFFKPFEQITALTDVAEGTIVRVITRLDETCREVRDAARVIGDAELFKKMEESQIKIKRDSECYPFLSLECLGADYIASCIRCESIFLNWQHLKSIVLRCFSNGIDRWHRSFSHPLVLP